jgi:hypothetical protein
VGLPLILSAHLTSAPSVIIQQRGFASAGLIQAIAHEYMSVKNISTKRFSPIAKQVFSGSLVTKQ